MKCDVHPKYSGKGAPRSRCTACNRIFVKVNAGKSDEDLARILKVQLRTIGDYRTIVGAPPPPEKPLHMQVEEDIHRRHEKESNRSMKKKYEALQDRVDALNAERQLWTRLGNHTPNVITPLQSHGDGEATAILVASDWHVEEIVTPRAVNGRNAYTIEIARKRAEEFFQVGLHLRNLEARNTPVPNIVLALLGDFITGAIHEEGFQTCSMPAVPATLEAQSMIFNGIDFLLKESDANIQIQCHVGNHARTTFKRRHSETELLTSYEYFLYHAIAQRYQGNPRVSVFISQAYVSPLKVYDVTFRMHHGHSIRYAGGVGGIDVPARRFIMTSNYSWPADYDLFGHHHTQKPSDMFYANGSMIGYNAYAQDNGFKFEVPSQTYLLVNKRWPKVIDYRPILFSV